MLQEAERISQHNFLGNFSVRTKSSATDFVTSVDTEIEASLTALLGKNFPEDGIVAEEGGVVERGRRSWVIDPLDGTSNFRRGRPNWSTSVALRDQGDVILAGVTEPLSNRRFLSAKGEGAWVSDVHGLRRISVSSVSNLADATGSTGFSNNLDFRRIQARLMAEASMKVLDIRQYGSAVLDLCHVADGSQDFYFEGGLKDWDLAAGSLIIAEAGGVVWKTEGLTACSTPELMRPLNEVIASLG